MRGGPHEPTVAGGLGLLYAALFIIYGIQSAYFPVWLDWRGLTATEISIIAALPMLLRIGVMPTVAVAADRGGTHARTLRLLSVLAAAAIAVLPMAGGFWLILALATLLAVASATMMPLVETIAMRGVRTAGLDYGRMRLWGSVSFIAATVGGGLAVESSGAGVIVWLLAGGAVATMLAADRLARSARADPIAATAVHGPLLVGDAFALARSPVFLMVLAAAALVQATHAVMYAFGTLHWIGQSIAAGWIGALWAIGVIAEIALFACSASVVRWVGAPRLIVVGAVASIVRWAAMALDPPLAVLAPLQVLHGLTFGATHLGAVHCISRVVADGQAGTAQALYTTASGAAMGLAMLAAGALYARFAGGAYLGMAAIAVAGLVAGSVLVVHLGQSEPGRRP